MVDRVKEYCDKWRLEVNVSKTKVMVVSKDGMERATVKYGSWVLECVGRYPYLGTLFSADGKWELEVNRRIQAGRGALSKLSKKVVWNRNISMKVKKVLFEAMVKSRLMYGGDVWWPNKKEVGRLETVQNDFIRWLSGVSRKDCISVSGLRKEVEIGSIEDSLCCKRLQWLGRLTRMASSRLVSRVWGAQCEGKRAKGRPRWIYAKQEAEDLARGSLGRLDALDKVKLNAAIKAINRPL